jgi:glutaminase
MQGLEQSIDEIDLQAVLDEIEQRMDAFLDEGKVADYIPALAGVDPKQFAMSITLFDGRQYHVGSYEKLFSIQSISKVFTFTMALQIYSKSLYERIGVEPSGNPFNSLVQLEYEQGKPRNPFINAGAINVTDALMNYFQDYDITYNAVLEFIQAIADDDSIVSNPIVSESEMEYGFRNIALANLMKSFHNWNKNHGSSKFFQNAEFFKPSDYLYTVKLIPVYSCRDKYNRPIFSPPNHFDRELCWIIVKFWEFNIYSFNLPFSNRYSS